MLCDMRIVFNKQNWQNGLLTALVVVFAGALVMAAIRLIFGAWVFSPGYGAVVGRVSGAIAAALCFCRSVRY